MVSNFGGILKLVDLDDYIAPSQECIKPVDSPTITDSIKLHTIRIKDGKYTQIDDKGKELPLKKAQITLSDCLACSGCVTSAETVLITQQSVDELNKVHEENLDMSHFKQRRPIVVSCSLQSLTSLSIYYNMSVLKTAENLSYFFQKHYDTKLFVNNVFARNMSLLESAKEFVSLYQTTFKEDRTNDEEYIQRSKANDTLQFPIISSICPGWVCYAEKSLSNFILPHMSRVRSPQQVMGAMLKSQDNFLALSPENFYCNQTLEPANETAKTPNVEIISNGKNIFHVSIMPCYDKKLEATRKQFTHGKHLHNEENMVTPSNFLDNRESNMLSTYKDVDCVLSTLEIRDLLDQKCPEFRTLAPQSDPTIVKPCEEKNSPLQWLTSFDYNHLGDGSGGYAEFIMRYAAKHCFGINEFMDSPPLNQIRNYRIETLTLKNKDMREIRLLDTTQVPNKPLLTFAQAYGFKNIQNVIQRYKRTKKCPYLFIEIMACPGGCLNGGGQIRNTSIPTDVLTQEFETYCSDTQNMEGGCNKTNENNTTLNGQESNFAAKSNNLIYEKLLSAKYHSTSSNYVTNPVEQIPAIKNIYEHINDFNTTNPQIINESENSKDLFYTSFEGVKPDKLLTALQVTNKW